MVAAIVSAGECTATAPTVSKRTRMDIRSSAGLAEQLGLHAEEYSDSEGPGSAVEPPSCTALVALDSAAAPLKLQQKLTKRWRKKWVKLFKKRDRKQRLKRVEDEFRKAWQEHRATTTVGELRAMVGQAVGVPLDGRYRLRKPSSSSQAHRPGSAEHSAASPLPGARGLSPLRWPGRGVVC